MFFSSSYYELWLLFPHPLFTLIKCYFHGIYECNIYVGILIYISNKMQLYTVYFIWKLLYIFRVVPPPIIRSAKTVSTASGICHTVTAICLYRGRVGTGLSVLWVAYWRTGVSVLRGAYWRTPPTAHSNQFQLFHDRGR